MILVMHISNEQKGRHASMTAYKTCYRCEINYCWQWVPYIYNPVRKKTDAHAYAIL